MRTNLDLEKWNRERIDEISMARRREGDTDLVFEPEQVPLQFVGEIRFPPRRETHHGDDDLGLSVIRLLHCVISSRQR